MKSLVLLGPNTHSTGKTELKFISNLSVPDNTIQTKSFKAKKIKISNEWWGNLSETTGLSVEEIAKFLTDETQENTRNMAWWMSSFFWSVSISAGKKSVYILKLYLEHADNMFWRKSMRRQGCLTFRNIFNQ